MQDIDEYASDILVQVYEELTRQYLVVLGLAFRLEGEIVEKETWLTLFKLAVNVVERVSHTDPVNVERTVLIAPGSRASTNVAWIAQVSKLSRPYWIAKSDLHKLQKLEAALDKLTTKALH
jgi:hypothetical protein